MGLDTNGIRLLIKAKELGVNFEKVITIGRQNLNLKEKEMNDLLIKAGLFNEDAKKIFSQHGNGMNPHSKGNFRVYSESFFNLLGASVTDSMDVSDYEGATVIQDLNKPMGDLKKKYTLVLDGGSLEHVFNFPVAIKNCMDLIEKNGYYIGITPSNNFFGHGFYQFSPELYFRVFNESNGFKVIKMFFFIDKKGTPIYELLDPLDLRTRSTMVNSAPTYLFIIAQKTEEKVVFEKTPQQSDYEGIGWVKGSYGLPTTVNHKPFTPEWVKKLVPAPLKVLLYYLIKKIRHIFRFFKRIIIQPLKQYYKIHTTPTGSINPTFIKKTEE